MSDDAGKPNRKVGYRSPPTEHQFRKGQSGNPRGRRKATRGMSEVLMDELQSKVKITRNGKSESVTLIELAMKKLAHDMAAGKQAAFKIYFVFAQMNPDVFGTTTIADFDEEAADEAIARFIQLHKESNSDD